MKTRLHHVAAVIALAASTSLAQAAAVNITAWTFGSGNVVQVAGQAGYPAINDWGNAGGFKGSVTFTGTENGFSGTISNFYTYCVELGQSFSMPSGSMAGYSVLAGAADPAWTNANGNGQTAAATAARLGQLLSYVDANLPVTTSVQSTSLQLAIWNVIYDTDNTLTGGIFKETLGGGYNTLANNMLASSASWGSAYNVYVLADSVHQDFLLTDGVNHPTSHVPEPASLALVGLAFCAAGVVTRRRRSA